jgi:hypothetical protein
MSGQVARTKRTIVTRTHWIMIDVSVLLMHFNLVRKTDAKHIRQRLIIISENLKP